RSLFNQRRLIILRMRIYGEKGFLIKETLHDLLVRMCGEPLVVSIRHYIVIDLARQCLHWQIEINVTNIKTYVAIAIADLAIGIGKLRILVRLTRWKARVRAT